jgi:hypothetical protein
VGQGDAVTGQEVVVGSQVGIESAEALGNLAETAGIE